MYTRSFRSLPSILRSFKGQFLWYGPYVTVVYVAYAHFGVEALDIKMSIATVLGFAVALLLGFRTSASYDRWWEARKIWGGIVNDSRSIVRQLIGFTNPKDIPSPVERVGRYQIAWCHVLKDHLRGLDPMSGMSDILTPEEYKRLEVVPNKRLELQKWIQLELHELHDSGHLDSIKLIEVDSTLRKLTDHMGKAERINNTVFPTQYRSYTHRGIILFTLMLPYGMLYSTGPFVILICVLVSFFFSMLEDIAYHLQDPFMNRASDIPMNALSRTIERDILQMLGEDHLPDPISPNRHGILM